MTGFIVAAALAVVLVLVLLLRPFLWKTAGAANASHRQLNAAIYRDQFVELERDRAEGTLGEDDYAQARAELQRRVLEDGADEEVAATPDTPKKTVIAIVLAIPLAAVGLYLLLGNPGGVVGQAPQQRVSQQDIDKMVAGLAEKLEKEPGNLKGWAMLARSYKALGRPIEAEKAYERAGAFVEGDAQLLADYADVVASNANGNFAGKPAQLIEKALKLDPDNSMALWLAGTAAFRGGDYDDAIRVWEKLTKQLPPESDDAHMLQGAIDEARAKGGKSAPAGKTRSSPAAAVPAGGASVSGSIELVPALKGKAAPDDTVMIIARRPGERMPLAVLKARAAELPMKFKLDDSLSMSPQARISTASEVNVEARISKSGMAMPEPGDLISSVQTVKVGATGIKLRVDQVRP
jgi:cytochrome c-type biogenesis protein CcmH